MAGSGGSGQKLACENANTKCYVATGRSRNKKKDAREWKEDFNKVENYLVGQLALAMRTLGHSLFCKPVSIQQLAFKFCFSSN